MALTIDIQNFNEEVSNRTNVSGSTNIDISVANTFYDTLNGNVTYSFINPTTTPSGNSFSLILEQDGTGGHSVTWPAGVVFTDGLAPDTDGGANTYDIFTFMTPDGGSTWIGMQGVAGGKSI